MDVITFPCPACKQVLKIGADKAGRKGKCKCGAEIVIPSASTPAPAPPAAKVDEDDEGGIYGLIGTFDVPKTEEKPRKRDEDEDEDEEDEDRKDVRFGTRIDDGKGATRRPRAPKARTLLNPEQWLKVCSGLNLISIGLWIWLGAMVLREIPVLIGLFSPCEYAKVRMRWENPKLYSTLAREGPPEDIALSKTEFMYGLVTGNDALTLGLWILRLSALVLLGASGTLIAGYSMCLPVPPRFGTRGQVYALLTLGSLNVLFTLLFRLLPTFGAMDYMLVPVALPEVAMVDANTEREVPLAVALSSLPFLDYTLSFVVLLTFFAEPLLLAIFLRSIALSMRGEELEKTSSGMIRLAVGQAFIWLAYIMVMICGSSDMLLWLLRVVYLLAASFFLGQLGWFAVEVAKAPPQIQKELDET
jgi:hypothetical protein